MSSHENYSTRRQFIRQSIENTYGQNDTMRAMREMFTIHTIHTIHTKHSMHTIHTIHTIHALHTMHTSLLSLFHFGLQRSFWNHQISTKTRKSASPVLSMFILFELKLHLIQRNACYVRIIIFDVSVNLVIFNRESFLF